LDNSGDRGRAREELGLPEDALVVSVFVHPGRRTEKVAPIFDLLMPAFDSIESPNKWLVWLAGEDCEMLEERTKDRTNVIVKNVVVENVVAHDSKVHAEDEPFDRLMAASDIAITKGNRNIVLELAALGIPSISISHGLNRMDDIRTPQVETNITLQSGDVDSQLLHRRMHELLSSSVAAQAGRNPAFENGVAGVARRLAERIETLSEKAASAGA